LDFRQVGKKLAGLLTIFPDQSTYDYSSSAIITTKDRTSLKPTNPVGLNTSYTVSSSSASQQIPRSIWKPKIYGCIHKSLSLTQLQSTSSEPFSPILILTLSFHLRSGLTNILFPSVLPTKTVHAFLFAPIRTTCSARRIHLNSFMPIVKVILFWVTKGILRTNLEFTMLGPREKDYAE
jgi:hypothetical protein